MLGGKFVTLRLIEKGDIEVIRQWRNTPELYRFFASRDFISEPQQENWFASKATSKASLFLLIIDHRTSERVGMIHLESIDHKNQNACWGIYIADPDARVGAIALEAHHLLFNYAFGYLNLRKIYGNTLATNPDAMKFFKGLGFVEEGCFREQYFLDDGFVDLKWVALFKTDWDQKKSEIEAVILSKGDQPGN